MRFEQFKNLAKMRKGAGNKLKNTIKKQFTVRDSKKFQKKFEEAA